MLSSARSSKFFAIMLMSFLVCEAQAHNPNLRRDLRIVRMDAAQGVSVYTPTQMKHAYALDQISGTGQGETIAIIDAFGSPTLQNDINVFSQQFDLPAVQVQVVLPSGAPAQADTGWAEETSLDVQWAHAIAPNAKLILIEAKSDSQTDLVAALTYVSQNAATLGISQVSMSWGTTEFASETSLESLFSVSGVTFTASSGDSGTGTIWPAVSPHVVAVGGTSLVLDASGNRITETAWVDSGGGESMYFSIPSFQAGAQTTTQRGVPDVSYSADPNYGVPVYYSGTGTGAFYAVGGTSAGAPQWAAIFALVNSQRKAALTSAATAIYSLASTNSAAYFHDITSGCNGKGPISIDCAGTHYDFVTGLGTPLSSGLVPALVSYAATATTTGTTTTGSGTTSTTTGSTGTSSSPHHLAFTIGGQNVTGTVQESSRARFTLGVQDSAATATETGSLQIMIDGALAYQSTAATLPIVFNVSSRSLGSGTHTVTAVFVIGGQSYQSSIQIQIGTAANATAAR